MEESPINNSMEAEPNINDTISGFGKFVNPKEDFESELNTALNPKSIEQQDLLDEQLEKETLSDNALGGFTPESDIKIEKPEEELKEDPLLQFESESKQEPQLKPSSEPVQEQSQLSEGEESHESKKFVLPKDFLDYAYSIVKNSSENKDIKKKLAWFQWSLENKFMESKAQTIEFLDKKKLDGIITDEECEKLKSLLEQSEKDDMAEHQTESQSMEVPVPEESTNTEKEIPTAIEIAMRATDKYVENKPKKEEVSETPEGVEGAESTQSTENGIENGEDSLGKARDEYVRQLVSWKEEHRKKKNMFHRILADLGVEKPLPETEKPASLLEAEEEYIKAKKDKYTREGLFSKVEVRSRDIEGQILNLREIKYEFNAALSLEKEKEEDIILKKMMESFPERESSIITRNFDKWRNLNRGARIAISSALLTGANLVFGSITLPAAATYAGYRVARSAVGATAGLGAGKLVDGIQKKRNKKTAEEETNEQIINIDEDNFAEREKQMLRLLENKDSKIKRQNLYKAMAMVGAGGLATVGTGVALDALHHADVSQIGETNTGHVGVKTEISEVPHNSIETSVDLSPKGFIEDIQNLKVKIIQQYGGINNVPEDIRTNVLDHSSIDLAKEFGLYDTENGTSALGLKGETLGIDTNGNIVINHLDGNHEVLFDAEKGTVHQFSGKMIHTEAPQETGEVVVNAEETSPEVLKPEVELNNSTDSTVATSEYSDSIANPDNNWFITFENHDGVKDLIFEHNGVKVPIAHEISTDYGKVMVLDDKYQTGGGVNKLAREAFNVAFENYSNSLGDIPPIPFEGGSIKIVHGVLENPDEFRVLLNGKEFAEGLITKDGPDSQLQFGPGIRKASFLMADTPYERAFKYIEPIIKTLKIKQHE